MTDAKRGRASRRGIYLCAVAALGFALSGCGGGGGGGSAATPTSSASTSQAATGLGNAAPPTASSGGVTINWTPPTENIDGSPLTDLAGYNIHYGTASGDYTQTITVSNPGLATYVVDNLTPGTYYFSVAAVNSAGTESPLSAEVSTTVN
jgi:Fibronectin type III domain